MLKQYTNKTKPTKSNPIITPIVNIFCYRENDKKTADQASDFFFHTAIKTAFGKRFDKWRLLRPSPSQVHIILIRV